MNTLAHLWQYLAEFFLEWEMFEIKAVEKIKTRILCSVTFFSENRVVCELMWEKMMQPETPQMTVRRMRVAC